MSTYEIDDDLVREFLSTLHESEDELPSGKIGKALDVQIPLPTPLHPGAVVRTEGGFRGGVYLRWAHDNATTSPWIAVGDHEEPHRTDQIGRIVEVLSEGVDL